MEKSTRHRENVSVEHILLLKHILLDQAHSETSVIVIVHHAVCLVHFPFQVQREIYLGR